MTFGEVSPVPQRRDMALHPGALPPGTSYMLSSLHFVLPQKCGRLLPLLGHLPGRSWLTELHFTVDGHLHAPCTTARSCMTPDGPCYHCCRGADSAAGGSVPFWPSPTSPGRGRDALQRGFAWRQHFSAQTTQDTVAGCPRLIPEAGTSLGCTGQPQQEKSLADSCGDALNS